MSSNNNRFEDLRDDEQRSEENSEPNQDDRDFIAPEGSVGIEDGSLGTENERQAELRSSREREALAGGQDVTILNIHGVDALQGTRITGIREATVGLDRMDLSASGTNSGLNLPSANSTIPENSGQGQGAGGDAQEKVPATPVGLRSTRVIRHSTMSGPNTLATHRLAEKGDHYGDSTVQEKGSERSHGPRLSSSQFLKPRTVEGLKENNRETGRRGVILDDDFYGTDDDEDENEEEEKGEAEESGLEKSERKIWESLLVIQADCDLVEMRESEHQELLKSLGDKAPADQQYQRDAVERVNVLGTCVPTLLRDPEHLTNLRGAEAGLWIGARNDIGRMIAAAEAAAGMDEYDYNIEDIKKLVSDTGGELNPILKNLQGIPAVTLESMIARHNKLGKVLNGGPEVTKADKRQAFPKQKASQILDWYVKTLVAAKEINRIQAAMDYSLRALEDHWKRYPLELKEPPAKVKVKTGEVSTLTTPVSYGKQSAGGILNPTIIEDLPGPASAYGLPYEEPWHLVGKSGRRPRKIVPESVDPQEAANLGFYWRQGQGNEDLDMEEELRRQEKKKKLKSDKIGIREREEAMNPRSEDDDEISGLTSVGSTNWDRAAIKETLREYIMKDLEDNRMGLNAAVRIIVENLPLPIEPSKRRDELKLVDAYGKVCNYIKPKIDEDFFNMYEWLKDFNTTANEYKFSIIIRLRMLEKHGGMKEDPKTSLYRDRIIKLMSTVEDWVPDYDPLRDESDYEYWLYIWTDVCLKFVKEFYHPMEESAIETSLRAKFKDIIKNKLESKDNAINNQWLKVDQAYKDGLELLDNLDSAMKDDAGYCMRILREELKKKPVLGEAMEGIIGDRIKLLIRDPEKALPVGHKISAAALKKITQQGPVFVPQKTYLLLMDKIVRDGTDGEHVFKIQSQAALQKILDGKEEKKPSKKKETATLNTVTASKSAGPTGQTQGGRGGGGGSSGGKGHSGGRGGGGSPQPWAQSGDPPCDICGMFCWSKGGKCNWTDSNTGKLHVLNFAAADRNRYFTPQGACRMTVSGYHKLEGFYFKKAGITDQAEKDRVKKAIEDAMDAYSLHNPAKHVNFAGQTEGKLKDQYDADQEQEKIVAMAKRYAEDEVKKVAKAAAKKELKKKKKKKKSKKKLKKRKSRRREDTDDSDSDSSDDEDASDCSAPSLDSSSESEEEY